MANLKCNLGIMKCSECEKHNAGLMIFNELRWGDRVSPFLKFDRENKTIVINQDELMRLIQIANPTQKVRPLKFVSEDEFKGATRT